MEPRHRAEVNDLRRERRGSSIAQAVESSIPTDLWLKRQQLLEELSDVESQIAACPRRRYVYKIQADKFAVICGQPIFECCRAETGNLMLAEKGIGSIGTVFNLAADRAREGQDFMYLLAPLAPGGLLKILPGKK